MTDHVLAGKALVAAMFVLTDFRFIPGHVIRHDCWEDLGLMLICLSLTHASGCTVWLASTNKSYQTHCMQGSSAADRDMDNFSLYVYDETEKHKLHDDTVGSVRLRRDNKAVQ
jgi:hypothetical protein